MSDNQQGGQFNQGQTPQFGQQGAPQQPGAAGQQQYGQEQFGQQPQAGQPQGDQPWTPPAEPKKKNPLLGRIGGLLVAAVVAIGFYAASSAGILPGGIKVGSCISVTKSGSNYKEKKVDCSDEASAPFLVVEKQKTSCAEPYVEYSLKSRRSSSTTYYCLVPELQQGKCYKEATAPLQGWVATTCGAGADLKVTKRADSANATCGEGEIAQSYPKDPARSYCLGDPEA